MACLKKRNGIYYVQYYLGTKQKRVSLQTDSYQLAKAKLAKLELNLAQGNDALLPTRTSIADVLTRYVAHIRTHKTPKSAQTEIYYLREMFGPICDAVNITSRRPSSKTKKRPPKPGIDRRRREHTIEAHHFEQITTADIAEFIQAKVCSRGLAPKTANHYRQIITRLFNWAMSQGGVILPGEKNPGASVQRYRERASQIRFLTLPQIDEQLASLAETPQLQVMVALYIYAGLRREEALWLQGADIDLRAGVHGMIRVRAKTFEEESWEPKTKSNRAVPISQTLRSYLDSYTSGISWGGWYFPSPQGSRWDTDNFSTALRKSNRKHNLPWSCLDYRHTFGSQLAQAGVSLYKISTLMGNSPEICRRHYAALIPEQLADCVEFNQPQEKARRQFNQTAGPAL